MSRNTIRGIVYGIRFRNDDYAQLLEHRECPGRRLKEEIEVGGGVKGELADAGGMCKQKINDGILSTGIAAANGDRKRSRVTPRRPFVEKLLKTVVPLE